MIRRIHVNRHNIRANRKGENLPVFTVKTYKENVYGHTVNINGSSTLVYSPDKPLSCGAVAWIETHEPVTVQFDGGSVEV